MSLGVKLSGGPKKIKNKINLVLKWFGLTFDALIPTDRGQEVKEQCPGLEASAQIFLTLLRQLMLAMSSRRGRSASGYLCCYDQQLQSPPIRSHAVGVTQYHTVSWQTFYG